MNKQPQHTQGLVLTRTNYGEADRIVTLLTRHFGKVRVLAKGVRKERSKLAGGVELFGVSEIGFVYGRGELATLTSARLIKHYSSFLNNLSKIDFAYGALKLVNKFTTDDAGEEYFVLTQQLFMALDEPRLSLDALSVWWAIQFSNISGHAINLETVAGGSAFGNNQSYTFDAERGGFVLQDGGTLTPNHVKFMRLALLHGPLKLVNVQGGTQLAADLAPYVRAFIEYQF